MGAALAHDVVAPLDPVDEHCAPWALAHVRHTEGPKGERVLVSIVLRGHLLEPPLVGIAPVGLPLGHRLRRRQAVHKVIIDEIGTAYSQALDMKPTFPESGVAVPSAALLASAVAPLLGGRDHLAPWVGRYAHHALSGRNGQPLPRRTRDAGRSSVVALALRLHTVTEEFGAMRKKIIRSREEEEPL